MDRTEALLAYLKATSPRSSESANASNLAVAALSTALVLADGSDPMSELLVRRATPSPTSPRALQPCGTSDRRNSGEVSPPRFARGAAGKPLKRSAVPQLPHIRGRGHTPADIVAARKAAAAPPPIMGPDPLWGYEVARMQLADRAVQMCDAHYDALAAVALDDTPRRRPNVPLECSMSPRAFYSKGLHRSPRAPIQSPR